VNRLENIQTFVRTLGNQFIKGEKHFEDDVFVSPNVSASVADVYLTVDENGRVVSRLTSDVAADLGISGGAGNFMLRATYDTDNDGVVDKAERIDIAVRNNSGSLIPNGSVIYLNGSTGNRPTIALASATSEGTSSKTFGIVNGNIAHESDGYVTVLGTIHTLDTSEVVAGTNMWLNTVAGQMISVPPQTPNHAVFLGVVTRSHPTAGSMVINIQNGFELGELHDVSITDPSNRDSIRYDSSTSTWKNRAVEYTHTQSVASNTWTINHNLGKYPSVMVVDSAGSVVIGDISYVTINQIIVYFSGTFSGKAYLN
jgi:hypothetical protein